MTTRHVLVLTSESRRKQFWEMVSLGQYRTDFGRYFVNFSIKVFNFPDKGSYPEFQKVVIEGEGRPYQMFANGIVQELHLVRFGHPFLDSIQVEAGITQDSGLRIDPDISEAQLQDALGFDQDLAKLICQYLKPAT